MFRNPVQVRDARPDDARTLLDIWAGVSRRTHAPVAPAEAEAEAEASVARIVADPDERLVVAVVNDVVVGAVHLRRAWLSPVHNESAVQVSHLQVLETWQRRGVGRALMEAAVSWAEDKDTGHIFAAASATSRDANRFLARLGLTQLAVVRSAPVAAVRSRLPVEAAACAHMPGSRPSRVVGQVLARRRSARRGRTGSVS